MKNYSVFLLLISLILISCEKERVRLSGQVFVVTNGAQNIPLGLVSIGISDSKKFGLALDSALIVFNKGVSDLENSIIQKKNEIEGENILKNSLWNDVLNEANSKTLNSFAIPGQPYALIDARPKYNFFKNWIKNSEERRDLDLRIQGVEYYVKRLKLPSLNDYYGQVIKIDSQLNELKKLEKSLEDFKNDNSVISDLSKSFGKTKTNAQGEFSLEAEKGHYFIFASSSRLVGGEVEKYMWCMEIFPEKEIQDLFLSNDNLVSINDLRNISKKLNSDND